MRNVRRQADDGAEQLEAEAMRPDYCTVAKEPCQAMCDPKCRLRKPPTDRELAAAYTNAQSQAQKHIGHIHGLRAVAQLATGEQS